MAVDMTVNMGTTDRIIRIVIGALFLIWALRGGPQWAWIGLIPFVTGLIRVCPVYSILKINTLGAKKE